MLTMIKGIGTDIIEIDRIRKSIERFGSRFYKRIFTANELDYCLKHQDPVPSLAARFAAKEAIAKALGTGIGTHLSWLDIEIRNNSEGCPEVFIPKNRYHIKLSISHCHAYATATAIWT